MMRIVVIGGNGYIGTRLSGVLRAANHEVVAVSPTSGVKGEGLVEVLAGADALVDVADPPSLDAPAVLDFVLALSRDLLAAGALARVKHVVLSMVGVDRVEGRGYFLAKAEQEELVRRSSIPYTIVRSTQSFEAIDRVLQIGVRNNAAVRLPVALVQPVAADDLAGILADIASAPPKNGTVEVAGPEVIHLHEIARLILGGREVPRHVTSSARARYLGALLGYESLMPGPDPLIGSTRLRDWLRQFITAG